MGVMGSLMEAYYREKYAGKKAKKTNPLSKHREER
jgi:hypothetical protein